jgi:hypothetical protein
MFCSDFSKTGFKINNQKNKIFKMVKSFFLSNCFKKGQMETMLRRRERGGGGKRKFLANQKLSWEIGGISFQQS